MGGAVDFLTSQPNEILSTAKPADKGVDEQSGISLTMRVKMQKKA
ncbi:MAG: hypothetical protein ACQEWT_11500 [Bacillota bacterium]